MRSGAIIGQQVQILAAYLDFLLTPVKEKSGPIDAGAQTERSTAMTEFAAVTLLRALRRMDQQFLCTTE
ncbi:hypothetical protein DPMN_114649 [Dreissena polymorpha]|uniref:Uncharacterized protein n=1 Tax=Dreissena polymorpha TaxID=45954 RepID=A0A9D4KJV3_DREPO|nr:hypothetical protein DPMN_114649 [Dreissena polymorpha]